MPFGWKDNAEKERDELKGWKTTWIKQETYDKLKKIKKDEEKMQYLVNKAVEEYVEKKQ